MLLIRQFLPFSPALLHPNTMSEVIQKLSRTIHHFHQSYFHCNPHIFPKKYLLQTRWIFWLCKVGFYHRGQICFFVFLTSGHAYPQITTDWWIKGGWTAHNGFDFQKHEKNHLSFPNTLRHGTESVYKSSNSFHVLQPFKKGEGTGDCICSAWTKGERGLPGCIQQHFIALF